jgi:hypothetical protein
MPDEDHVGEVELTADLENVLGVAVERRIAIGIPGRQVGATEAHVVEEHHTMIFRERGPDVPPHALVAAVPVREEHRARSAASVFEDVVARDHRHGG